MDAFLILCEAQARYRNATALVNGSALLVQGGSGLMKNPALQMQSEAERTFLTYAARFGLTPSDRQSIKVEEVPCPESQLSLTPTTPPTTSASSSP